MVNKTSTDMSELVDLLTQLVHNLNTSSTPLSVVAEGEKTIKVEPTNEDKTKSIFLDSYDEENDQPATSAMENVARSMGGRKVVAHQLIKTLCSGQPENSTTVHPSMTRSPSGRIDKGKGIATPCDDATLKAFMPLMEQGRSTLKLSIFKKFITSDDPSLTIKKAAQIIQEEKRFANLKAANEKTEKALERMNPAQRMA
ncbi:hypothetical protein Tco_0151023 [Tanacetum coccineum]